MCDYIFHFIGHQDDFFLVSIREKGRGVCVDDRVDDGRSMRNIINVLCRKNKKKVVFFS